LKSNCRKKNQVRRGIYFEFLTMVRSALVPPNRGEDNVRWLIRDLILLLRRHLSNKTQGRKRYRGSPRGPFANLRTGYTEGR